MGNFFTSTQIFNNKKLSKDQFVDKFCKKMAEDGYVACDSDESELSYILRFADNCKWVAITSEAYEQGNQTSQKDTGRIAKMLGTNCVNTVVIDSDCAIMVLYDEKGKKADTLILGRADDYFGDDIPQPSEKIFYVMTVHGSFSKKYALTRRCLWRTACQCWLPSSVLTAAIYCFQPRKHQMMEILFFCISRK